MKISFVNPCDHSPEKWSMDASPQKAGGGFLLTIRTITCSCGAVANITDTSGRRSPAVTVGVDFFTETVGGNMKNHLPPQLQEMPKAPPKLLGVPQTENQLLPGPGTELSQELERLGMSSCGACKDLANLMNDWGPQGCRERIDQIVADVLPRARAWFDHATLKEKLSVWWNSNQKLSTALSIGTKASTWELDDALKEVIKVQVLSAIDRFEQKNNQS